MSRSGARLFNTHVGKFWAGVVVKRYENGDVLLRAARIVNVGVPGQSDLTGWTPVVITPDMVGQTLAVYSAVEIKAGKDRPTPEQLAYIAAVQKSGGLAGIARSVEDAAAIVTGSRQP